MKSKLETQEVLLIEPRRWFSKLGTISADIVDFMCEGDFAPEMVIGADGIAQIEVEGVIATGLPDYAE